MHPESSRQCYSFHQKQLRLGELQARIMSAQANSLRPASRKLSLLAPKKVFQHAWLAALICLRILNRMSERDSSFF